MLSRVLVKLTPQTRPAGAYLVVLRSQVVAPLLHRLCCDKPVAADPGGVVSEYGTEMAGGLGPGARIAGYLVGARIGAGPTGVVFAATDQRLARQLALRILRPGLAPGIEFRRRFLIEGRVAAHIDHPNILPVYDVADVNGVAFIAMRLAQGGSVRSSADRLGVLPADQVARIISQVAAALDAIHAGGLVHRNVKPTNLLLDSPGAV